MTDTVDFDVLCERIDEYLAAVAQGQRFIITTSGVEVAVLRPRRTDAASEEALV